MVESLLFTVVSSCDDFELEREINITYKRERERESERERETGKESCRELLLAGISNQG